MSEGLSAPRPPKEEEANNIPQERPKKEANPDVLLWQSFVFAQGAQEGANNIFAYLAVGPLKGRPLTREDFRKGLTSTVARNLRSSGAHEHGMLNTPFFLRKATGQERQATDDLLKALQYAEENGPASDEERMEIVKSLTSDFIARDSKYLEPNLFGAGRPVKPDSGRDRWSSFLIDFVVLKRGTHPWPYAMILPEYKQMLHDIDEYLESDALKPSTAWNCKFLVQRYREKHPNLDDEAKSKLAELTGHLERIAENREEVLREAA